MVSSCEETGGGQPAHIPGAAIAGRSFEPGRSRERLLWDGRLAANSSSAIELERREFLDDPIVGTTQNEAILAPDDRVGPVAAFLLGCVCWPCG